MTSYPLAVVRSDPLLEGYATLCRHHAHRQRRRYAQLLDQANRTIFEACQKHRELNDRITLLRKRIAAHQKGVPLTEFMDTPEHLAPLDSGLTEEERITNEFLLKKAWRTVRTLAHPDKGGSEEEFQLLKDAYQAKDLRALTEYVLSRDKTVLEQIEYWREEAIRPEVNWMVLQSSPQFKIVRAMMTGNELMASVYAELQLRARLAELELEALQFGLNPKL